MQMKLRTLLCSLVGILSLVVLLPTSRAQVTGATLSGTVTDSANNLVPNASVTVTNLSQGTTRVTTTNTSGDFTLPNLAPGDYRVEVMATGFRKEVRSNVTFTVGQVATLNFALAVGSVNETVQVEASTTELEQGSSAMSAVIQGDMARDLPLNGRDWTTLATLEPGTATVRSQNSAASSTSRGNRGYGQQISVAGGRPQVNSYRVDGIIANDYANSTPGNSIGLTLGADAIAEFSVITSNYSASYGMTGGGVINAITRAGTNNVHGSVYEFIRNDFFDAESYFDQSKLPFHRNQFGATFGGPVVKNKLFMFGNYEGLRNILVTTSTATVPTNSAKAGTFGGKTYTVDPAVLPYLPLWHAPNYALKTDTGSYRFPARQNTPENFFTIRGDYTVSPKDSIAGTYLWDDTLTLQPDTLNTKILKSFTDRVLVALSWNHIFTSNLYNSFRIGAAHEYAGSLISLPGANPVAQDPTLGAVPGLAAPNISPSSGITSFAGGVTGGTQSIFGFTTPQLSDDAFWTRGKHSIRFGALVMRFQHNMYQPTYNHGNFSFSSWPNFLTNVTNSVTLTTTNPTPIDLRQTVFGAYVEDSFKWTQTLTLTYGARYEMASVPTETANRLDNIRTVPSTTLYTGSPVFTNPTKKNFEPRLGFSYTPAVLKNRTVISGGYGLYDLLPLTYTFNLNLAQTAPSTLQISNRTTSVSGLFPKVAATYLSNPANGSYAVAYTQYNPPRSYTQQYNLTIQQQLPGKVSVKVGYVGSHATHLNMYTSDANTPAPIVNTKNSLIFPCAATANGGTGGTLAAGYTATNPMYVTCNSAGPKQNTAFGQIQATGWFAGSSYNGLLMSVRQRLKSFEWQSSFTWQKSLDTSSSVSTQTPYENSLVQYLFHPIKGPSDFNLPRVFITYGLWHVPKFVNDSSPLHYVLNGWQMNGIYQASDGGPFSVTLSGDTMGIGATNGATLDFPDRSTAAGCGGNPVNPGNRLNYIKLNCFSIPVNPPGQSRLGNAGRNQERGPAYQDVDIALMKSLYLARWGEGRRLELRGDAFNILNHPNLDPPYSNFALTQASGALVTSTASTSAGQITTGGIPRQIQVSAKLVF